MMTKASMDNARSFEAASNESGIVVLLIDDQPIIGEAVRRAIATESDIEFHYCGAATEAVATATTVKPTVIMQDLVMPEVDGLTLVKQYRQHAALQSIPVIVLSSKEDAVVKREAFATGAADYLVKLPDSIELIARLRHHSQAYIHRIQRDAAYRALSESQHELIEMNEKLRRLSDVDGLTGLNNRRYLDEYLESEWRRAIRDQQCFSILMIDVDDFKKYNDAYGHLAGDSVLKNLAKAMRQCAHRPADLTARFGGEEFAVILPSTPLVGARHIGEEVCSYVRQLAIPHRMSASGFVTVSVGGASGVAHRGTSYSPLLEAADVALYEAKRAGKNRACSSQL